MSGDGPVRRRPMARIGDLVPEAAARLGLGDELRRARAMSTFDVVVAEHAPLAHGACRAIATHDRTLVVEADAPIVAQELRLNATAILAAFGAAPGGAPADELRVVIRRSGRPGRP